MSFLFYLHDLNGKQLVLEVFSVCPMSLAVVNIKQVRRTVNPPRFPFPFKKDLLKSYFLKVSFFT